MAILAGDLSSAVPHYKPQKNLLGGSFKTYAEGVTSVA